MAIHAIRNKLGAPSATGHGIAKDGSIVKGQPVFLDTDGDIDGCATGAAEIIGIAPCASTADADFVYNALQIGDEWLIDFVKSSAYAVTDIGGFYGLKVTSGNPEVDLAVTNADALQLIGIESQVAAGTSGKAWVRVIDAVNQNKIVNA